MAGLEHRYNVEKVNDPQARASKDPRWKTMTTSEQATAQALMARGYSVDDAIEDALDGVEAWHGRLR